MHITYLLHNVLLCNYYVITTTVHNILATEFYIIVFINILFKIFKQMYPHLISVCKPHMIWSCSLTVALQTFIDFQIYFIHLNIFLQDNYKCISHISALTDKVMPLRSFFVRHHAVCILGTMPASFSNPYKLFQC